MSRSPEYGVIECDPISGQIEALLIFRHIDAAKSYVKEAPHCRFHRAAWKVYALRKRRQAGEELSPAPEIVDPWPGRRQQQGVGEFGGRF